MRVYKTIAVDIKKIEKVFCNSCGESIKTDKHGNMSDYLHIEKCWGYDSDMDGEEHSIDICQECYKEMIKKFKIKVN